MGSDITRFTDAIYHRQSWYDFEATVFSRRMLKVLLLIDGKRTAIEISEMLSIETHTLKPEFARLVELELIHTKIGVISAGLSGLFYNDNTTQTESAMT